MAQGSRPTSGGQGGGGSHTHHYTLAAPSLLANHNAAVALSPLPYGLIHHSLSPGLSPRQPRSPGSCSLGTLFPWCDPRAAEGSRSALGQDPTAPSPIPSSSTCLQGLGGGQEAPADRAEHPWRRWSIPRGTNPAPGTDASMWGCSHRDAKMQRLHLPLCGHEDKVSP